MFHFVHPIVMKIIAYRGGIHCIPTNITKDNLPLLFSYRDSPFHFYCTYRIKLSYKEKECVDIHTLG